MSEFYERLHELMVVKRISCAQLSASTNIPIAAIYSWLRAEHEPNAEYLLAAASLFGCSLDFLLGLSDNDAPIVRCRRLSAFPARLQEVMRERRITEYRLCKDTGLSRARFYDWKSGRRNPHVDNLLLICQYLDCSADALFYG